MVLRIRAFVMQDENDVLTALRILEEMHISVEALKVKNCFLMVFLVYFQVFLNLTSLFSCGIVLL